jgi:hypothetical protein
MKPTWKFEQISPMGGATGEAYANTLTGSGLPPDGLLAREAVQNSCDAALNPAADKVKMVFRCKTLRGEELKAFVQALALDETAARRGELDLPVDSCLEPTSTELPLLYVEDFYTHGLNGDPHDPDSHFFKLLLSLGDSGKARQSEGSGGSFGYGKSVYSANSRIRTIVAYSVFLDEETGAARHRLFGCSYFKSHKFGGKDWTGRAWFGIGGAQGVVHDPLEAEAAAVMAARLGFAPRSDDQTGTSILIVDCPVSIDSLRRSIEDWWWPRLIEDKLDVELHADDQRKAPPRPRSRPDLRPFVHCYDLATKRSEATSGSERRDDFNRTEGLLPGSIGIQTLSEPSGEDEESPSNLRTIALLRSPRMVVSYLRCGGAGTQPFVGVFVAHPDVDGILRSSEPPSHDKWDDKSTRLKPLEQKLVHSIIRRIGRHAREFATAAAPARAESEFRPKELERLLGTMFSPPNKVPGGPGPQKPDPVSIRFVKTPEAGRVDDQRLRITGTFQVALASAFQGEVADIELSVTCPFIEDEASVSNDLLPLRLELDAKNYDILSEHPLTVRFPLGREEKVTCSVVTEPYDHNWTTKLQVEAAGGAA